MDLAKQACGGQRRFCREKKMTAVRLRGGGPMRLRKSLLVVSLGLMAFPLACGDDDSGGGTRDGGSDVAVQQDGTLQQDGTTQSDGTVTGDGTVTQDGSITGDGSTGPCQVVACAGHVYQCGDCQDNDNDGLTDAVDPDCLGPCDNNETGYNTEIPGGNAAPCKQDCYFDQDTGPGNDECDWDHRCDPLQPVEQNTCDYSNDCANCSCQDWLDTQPQTCLDFCLPITPNGCDCFGCCQLGGEGDYRFIGSPGCNLNDLDSCSPCTPVPSCLNECGHCELCLGKTELPPDCTNDEDRCPPDHQPCGLEGDDPCPEGEYCITGCCVHGVE